MYGLEQLETLPLSLRLIRGMHALSLMFQIKLRPIYLLILVKK